MEDEVMFDENVVQENSTDTEAGSSLEDEPKIYTGPNVFALNLQRFQVFRGGLPPATMRAIEKIPEIEPLIVPVSELEEMRQKINRPGTNEARLFSTIQKEAVKLSRDYIKSSGKRVKR